MSLCAQLLLRQSSKGCGWKRACAVQALPDNGCLVACERDEQCMQLARKFWAAAGVSHKVSSMLSVLDSCNRSIIMSDTLQGALSHYSFRPLLRESAVVHSTQIVCTCR